ncbi:hypothetical protein PG999_003075 [Apiospora kogelbergensis]|uniref:FAD-binding PCMH-type domain-containing protein n=1 Tax=Apiospora kogelbergensis TaxID=1337665 RepID=A0AAW0RA65_9PEZI
MRVIHFSGLAILALVRSSVAAAVQSNESSFSADAARYRWAPGTVISYKGSPDFRQATERWDIYKPPTYSVAITPAVEADVATAVKLARQQKVPLLATGGRHGISTTLAKMQGGVAIDLSKLNSISIDKKAVTITVGPGVRFGDVYEPLYKAGFQIQTGTATCPGMIGVTLGGGIGRLDGLQGLVLDALVSARIVLANGTLLEVSKTSNPDLFWGVQGAGQNFGVVTSATYKVQPLYKGGIWTSVDLIVPIEKNLSYFKAVSGMLPMPADLTVQTTAVYNTTLKRTQLLSSLVYAGPKEAGLKAMAPILNLGPFPFQNVSTLALDKLNENAMFQANAAICVKQQIFDVYGFNLKTFDVPTMVSVVRKMSDFFDTQPAARKSALLLETWPNQAVMAVPDDATAYPWRDATTYGRGLIEEIRQIELRWDTPGDPVEAAANSLGRDVRAALAATSGYGNLTVYVNYAWGDESLESIYGAKKLPRLARLKAQYDPSNVFQFYHALPTSYP